MNRVQINKLNEVEDQAIDNYLNHTNFSVVEWLIEDEQKEYCELYNMQFDEKNCVCGTHKLWQ